MASEYAELQHKMSKKIAQLTKVIFHLNTKNEEHELQYRSLAEAYEKEIELIMSDSNRIISQQRDALDKFQRIGNPQEIIGQVQKQYEEQKKQAQTELETIKKKAEEREMEIARQFKGKFDQMKTEVTTNKQKLEKLQASLEGKELQSKGSIEELKRKHQFELENHVKEANAKYNDLLKAKLAMEDSLKESHSKEIQKINAQ